MGLFKKKKIKQGIIVNHGKGDIRRYPPTGDQVGLKLQRIESEEIVKREEISIDIEVSKKEI